MKKLTYIFLSLLVLAGCTGTSRQPQLVAMDSLLLSRPDSALTLLRSMSFSSTSDRMYYYLLLADACNKCYDTLPSDSILQEVAEYYDRHGSANEQVRAHYLLGCVYRDEGNAPLALKSYRIATELADTTTDNCDFLTLSRVYGQIASIFNMQRAPSLEIDAERKAVNYAWRAKDTISAIIFYESLCLPYLMLNKLDSALYYSQESAKQFRDLGHEDLAAGTLGLDIDIYLRRKDYLKAKDAINEYEHYSNFFDEEGSIYQGYELFYYYKGSYYEGIGRLDSAEYYYRRLLNYDLSINTKEALYKGLLSLYRQMNVGDSITKYSFLYCQANDSASFTHSADEITRMQTLYNYDESERRAVQEEKKAEKYRKMFFVVLSLILLCSYIAYRFIKRQKRLRKQELIKANTAYITLLAKYSKAQDDLKTAQQGLNNYRTKKEQEIVNLRQELTDYLEETELQKKWDIEQAMLHDAVVLHFHKLASRAQKASAVEWQDFNRFALDRLPSFINTICEESINLTDKELKVCMLARLHFAPAEVAALLDLSKQRISNIRANANRKLFNDGSATSLDANIHQL